MGEADAGRARVERVRGWSWIELGDVGLVFGAGDFRPEKYHGPLWASAWDRKPLASFNTSTSPSFIHNTTIYIKNTLLLECDWKVN